MSPLHYANVSGHEISAERLVLFCNDLQLEQSQEAIRQACMGMRDARSRLACSARVCLSPCPLPPSTPSLHSCLAPMLQAPCRADLVHQRHKLVMSAGKWE